MRVSGKSQYNVKYIVGLLDEQKHVINTPF